MIKVLIFANDESTIYNFRREILRAFVDEKFAITVCYPLGEHMEEIKNIGCKVENLDVSRHGKNPLQDLKLLRECQGKISAHKPDVVLTYTVKPNIYGSFASSIAGVPYINNITGLGSILQKDSWMSKIVLKLQKYAYKKSSCVFFQNTDNYQKLKTYGVVSDKTPCEILPGSGVNLQRQKYEPYPKEDGMIRFIIVSRIRKDKGYGEYLEAAEQLRKCYDNLEFHVVGWIEDEDLGERVQKLSEKGVIVYHGKLLQDEIHELLKKCHCLVHPSYHEGMANVLLEAAATGRPVIGTNIPGCKETFDEGVTGYGCDVRSAESLEEAMKKFICTPYQVQGEMGVRGRKKMEKEFDRNYVAQEYIKQIYKITEKRR